MINQNFDISAIVCQLENKGFPTHLECKAVNNETTKIRLSGVVINSDPFGLGGIAADDVIRQLNDIQTPEIEIELNSPGGSVIAGVAISNAIRAHKSRVHVTVAGIAASAATFPLCAADSCDAAPGSKVMIHKALISVSGREPELLKGIDLLKQTDADIVAMYKTKTGKSEDEICSAMESETYFTAQEAVEFGLIDKIKEYPEKVKAEADPTVITAETESLQDEKEVTTDFTLEKARRKNRLRNRANI